MSSEDEVEIVSTTGNVALRDYPHPRDRCLNVPFTPGQRAKACTNCWCFVCQVPFAACVNWAQHCEATDELPEWIAERIAVRRARERADRSAEDQLPEVAETRRDNAEAAAHAARAELDRLGDDGGAEEPAVVDNDEEVETLFQEYVPEIHSDGISAHPTSAFETTSLSFVKLPAVDLAQLKLLALVKAGSGDASEGRLSNLQIEAIALATERHAKVLPSMGTTAGFFLGDGPGVGKGRQVAGIIYENYLRGCKHHIWVSVSNDLLDDARRDVQQIGCPLKVYHLNKMSLRELTEIGEGIMFCTYATLIARESGSASARPQGKAAAAAAVAAASAAGEEDELDFDGDDDDDEDKPTRSRGPVRDIESIEPDLDPGRRLTQLVRWMQHGNSSGGAGTVVFDECHRAKNLVPDGAGQQTASAIAVLELQLALPQAKVVYCSATGCSSIKGMAYMVRLGLWGQGTPFARFADFVAAISEGGPGAMELVALDMKQRGMYLSRMLSYQACLFETVEVQPSPKQVRLYDAAVAFWARVAVCFEHAHEELEQLGLKPMRGVGSLLWGTHQRFFKQLCMGLKLSLVVERTNAELAKGHAVVIGLQSTGEARLRDRLQSADSDETLEDFRGLRALLEHVLSRFPCKESLTQRIVPEEGEKRGRGKAKAAKPAKPKARAPWALSAAQRAGASRLAAAQGAAAAAAAAEDDEDEDDEPPSVLADAQGVVEAQKAFRRRLEFVLPDELRELHDRTMDALGLKRASSYGKEPTIKSLCAQFALLAALSREELASRLLASGLPRAELPVGRGARVELLWRRRVGEASGDGAGAPSAKRAKVDDKGELAGAPGPALTYEQSVWRRLQGLKESMEALLEHLELPENPLDSLICELGGPKQVAELTGRKIRRVWLPDGSVEVCNRNKDLRGGAGRVVSMAQVNTHEKEQFLADAKRVAIISEAASSGISLHADKRFVNQRQRVHITIELPWSADEAIQQFGRTHRSNQSSAPIYVLVMTTIGGERRFASSVAKRLQALGALTKGDRRASDAANLDVFNFEHRYGQAAVDEMVDMVRHPFHAVPSSEVLDAIGRPEEHALRRGEKGPGPSLGAAGSSSRAAADGGAEAEEEALPYVDFPAYLAELEDGLSAAGVALSDAKYEKQSLRVVTFMNRMLGLPVDLQRRAFAHFSAQVDLLIKSAKIAGTFDDGVVDLNARLVRLHGEPQVVTKEVLSGASAKYYELELDRGMSWEAAQRELAYRRALDSEEGGRLSGFYVFNSMLAEKRLMNMLARQPRPPNVSESIWEPIYRSYNPHNGFVGTMAEREMLHNYRRVEESDATRDRWRSHYDYALSHCMHGDHCKNPSCLYGNRVTLQPFLGGCVLPMWNSVVKMNRSAKAPVKICRVRITDGPEEQRQRLVGIKLMGFRWQQHIVAEHKIKVTATKLGQPSDGSVLARSGGDSPIRLGRTRQNTTALLHRQKVVDLRDEVDVEEELQVLPPVPPAQRSPAGGAQPERRNTRRIQCDDDDEGALRPPLISSRNHRA